jgi:hypothetical protein
MMTGEVNNYAAVGTNQMVVVLRGTDGIASAVTSGMHFTDEPQFSKYSEGAVNSYQPDIGVNLTHLLIYGGWSKMVLGGSNGADYRSSLWGKFIAILPQSCDYFSLCKPHFKL